MDNGVIKAWSKVGFGWREALEGNIEEAFVTLSTIKNFLKYHHW